MGLLTLLEAIPAVGALLEPLSSKEMACNRVGDANDDSPVEQNKAKNSYEQWNYHESKELLKLMAEEVNNDALSRKEKITAIILPMVNAKFGRNKEYSHVKNKLTNWRLRIEPTKELDTAGIGWDRVQQKFIATDEMWENLKKAHPKSAALRNKIFEDYDKLKLVIGHYYPRGKEATVLRPCSIDRVAPVTDRKKDNSKVTEGATHVVISSPHTDDTPLSISQGPASAPSSSSTSIQRKRKAILVETPVRPLHANLEKLARNDAGKSPHEVIVELGSLNQPDNSKFLDAVDRVMEEMKWRAYDVFTTPTLKEAFLRMRLRFLLFKLKQAVSDQP